MERDAFTHLPGGPSVADDVPIVSVPEGETLTRDLRLSEPWDRARRLVGETDGGVRQRTRGGAFKAVAPGIRRMAR